MKIAPIFLLFFWNHLKLSREQLPLLVPFQEECVDVDVFQPSYFKKVGKVLRNACFWECYKIRCKYIYVGGKDQGKDDCHVSRQTFKPKPSGGCMVSRMFTEREYHDIPYDFINCSSPYNVEDNCYSGYDGNADTELNTDKMNAWLYFSFGKEILLDILLMSDSKGRPFDHKVYISSETVIFNSDGIPDYFNKLREVRYTFNQQINSDLSLSNMYLYTERSRLCARHLVIRADRNGNVINIKIDQVKGYLFN